MRIPTRSLDALILGVLLCGLLIFSLRNDAEAEAVSEPEVAVEVVVEPIVVDEEPAIDISEEDTNLLALVTMAEAEGESELGKRLVIDTILNRVDADEFPDTIYEVVYQPNQFSSMWNGRINRCVVLDSIKNLVHEELENRTNYEVTFFRTGHYTSFGEALFQEGAHYFSKSK